MIATATKTVRVNDSTPTCSDCWNRTDTTWIDSATVVTEVYYMISTEVVRDLKKQLDKFLRDIDFDLVEPTISPSRLPKKINQYHGKFLPFLMNRKILYSRSGFTGFKGKKFRGK